MPQKLLTYLICLLLSSAALAQSQKSLEKRKAQIQKEIKLNEKKLLQIKKQEKSTIKAIQLQHQRILLKEKLISTTADQISDLEIKIGINQTKTDQLNQELVTLSADYSQMIVKSYKSRSEQSRLMFILSSKDFMQAYKRIQYMKQYANFRRMQGQEISRKMALLNEYLSTLNSQRNTKQRLVEDNEREKSSLQREKKEKEKYATSLKGEKKKIEAQIKSKKAEQKKIDAKINKLIRDAIAAANKKNAAKKATEGSGKTGSDRMELTPEMKTVSDNFKGNKGRLLWPVEQGFISLGYGNQPHPIFNSLVIHNSGLEITTPTGSDARAVFSGVVVSVMVLSPTIKAVMIQHGDFFTVYQNLSSVYVSKGDKIDRRQSLGKVKTNPQGNAVLKFMLTQNTTYQNPYLWLSSK